MVHSTPRGTDPKRKKQIRRKGFPSKRRKRNIRTLPLRQPATIHIHGTGLLDMRLSVKANQRSLLKAALEQRSPTLRIASLNGSPPLLTELASARSNQSIMTLLKAAGTS
eukprot:5203518-Amphidinium_carterae.1